MNATLRERLIRAEQQFLLAVASIDEETLTLKDFSQEWSQLAHDIQRVEAAGQLNDDTALLLSQVSRAIENTANCMLESGAILQETQTCSLSDFIQDIPSDDPSSIASPHPHAIAPCHLLFSSLSSSMTPSILGQQKSLDPFAYRWLIQNIHNPYPSSAQTRTISDVSGTSTAQVELWFREARDSIGWSKLSHDFFAGSVNATVAAARRVYLERDRNISFDIVFAFTVVKAFAETLFSKHPSLQGKNVKMAMDQLDESGIDPEGIPVPTQANLPAPLDPFSDLSDSDDSEEEDTTPPPPIAGYKRALAEECDLGRPQKRSRSGPVNCTPSDEFECPFPFPSTSGLSSKQTIPSNSATFVLPSTRSHVLYPSPESLPCPPSFIPQRMGNAEVNKDTLEGAVSTPHTHVSTHGVRKRRLSQSDALMHSKRQCRFISPPTGHSNVKPISSSHSCPDLSLPEGRPSDFDESPQPSPPVLVKPDAPVNFGVFDWNSMSDPSVATASFISQPAIAYVPSSDLKSQLLEPPDFGHDAEARSHSFVDSGSLEYLSSSLQFPMPAVLPDPSSFTASPHLDSSSFPLQDFDWPSITGFIDTFSPSSTQSSSQSAGSNAPATPLGSSHESFFLSQSCDSTKQPSSVLDPSIPPSVFLPFDSGAFSEDMVNMWSFLRDGS